MQRHHVVCGKPRHLGGWKRNRPDWRDGAFTVGPDALVHKPPQAGPKRWRPRIEDQAQEGSCTANAGTSVIELLRKKHGMPEVQLARQGLYFSTRVDIEGGDPFEDSGATIRDTMKALCKYGVGAEARYPYTPENFARRPPPEYFAEAAHNKLLRFNHCPTVDSIKTMLALGFPVQLGFSVPNEMMQPGFNGFLPMPMGGFAGGHSVYTDWYDDTIVFPAIVRPGAFLCPNSWSEGFGLVGTQDAGCFWMPYEYVDRGLATDFCSPRLVMTP